MKFTNQGMPVRLLPKLAGLHITLSTLVISVGTATAQPQPGASPQSTLKPTASPLLSPTPAASPQPIVRPTISAQDLQELEQRREEERIQKIVEERLKNSPEVRDRIHSEVNNTFGVTTSLINILLVLLALLPFGAAFVLFLLRRSVISQLVTEAKAQIEKEIEREKSEALTQLQKMILESQNVLEYLKQHIEIANQEMESIRAETTTRMKNIVADAEKEKERIVQELSNITPSTSPTTAPTTPEIEQRIKELTAKFEALESARPLLRFTASDYLKQGNALFFESRYEEAIKYYDKAIQLKHDNHEAWHNKGDALRKLQRHEEAILAYEKAIHFQPEYYWSWNNHGVALRDLQRYEEAIISFEKANDIAPEYAEAWFNQGLALIELQQYERAITCFQKAIQCQPNFYQAWLVIGFALKKLGRYQESITSCEKAIQFKPDYSRAWYNKACSHSRQGNVDLTIKDLEQAINLAPKYREIAKTDSDFDTIREDERFKQLIYG